MTLLIVDPWQSCECFIKISVTRCTLLMVLFLDHMCQCGLHTVLWSHIGTLMHCLAAEQRSTAGLYSHFGVPLERSSNPVFDGVGLAGFKSRVNAFFIGLSCSIPTIVFYSFSLSLLFVCGLVLWGWDLWTDGVYIALSHPYTADLF